MLLFGSMSASAFTITPFVEDNLCFDGVAWSQYCSDGSAQGGVRVGAAITPDIADVGKPGAVGVTAYINGQAYMLDKTGQWVQYLGTPIEYAYYDSLPSYINIAKIFEGDKCGYESAEIYVGYGVLTSADLDRIDNYHKSRNPKITREHLIGFYTYLNGEKNNKYGLVYRNQQTCGNGNG